MICKGVELDVVRGCVKCQEQQVDLSKNELKILHYLFLHQGEIVPRIELVEYLWDQQVFIDDNALSVNITRLRAKLAEIGVCDFIETKKRDGLSHMKLTEYLKDKVLLLLLHMVCMAGLVIFLREKN